MKNSPERRPDGGASLRAVFRFRAGGEENENKRSPPIHGRRDGGRPGDGSAGSAGVPGYHVQKVGRYHTTKEMDSLRIKNRRTWFRYSENTGGDAITFLQRFCSKSFPEAVEYLLSYRGRARGLPR